MFAPTMLSRSDYAKLPVLMKDRWKEVRYVINQLRPKNIHYDIEKQVEIKYQLKTKLCIKDDLIEWIVDRHDFEDYD